MPKKRQVEKKADGVIAEEVSPKPVEVIIEFSGAGERVYSNYVRVGVCNLDCTLTFCEVPMSGGREVEFSDRIELTVAPKVVVVLPIGTLKELPAIIESGIRKQGALREKAENVT